MKTKGFSLIELIIVLAIIGILASFAAPKYISYRKSSQFIDVILATARFKSAISIAVQVNPKLTASDLNAGAHGIPATITTGEATSRFVDTVDVKNGKIIAYATSDLDNAVFELQAILTNEGLMWENTNTLPNNCINLGYC